jgi:tetratricopeptide (TPR) repeat protein
MDPRRSLVGRLVVILALVGATGAFLWLKGAFRRSPRSPATAARLSAGARGSAEEWAHRAAEAESAIQEGRLSAAEEHLRTMLESQPGNLRALAQLARVLRISGRRWESIPVFMELVRRDACDVDELVMLAGIELAVDIPDEFLRDSFPAARDPLVVLWRVQLLSRDDESARAESLLRTALAAAPELVEAQARLGNLLLDSEDPSAWLHWNAQLPDSASAHPEIWVGRGIWAQNQDELAVSARCFWEALRRDPDHRAANYRLAQVLGALGQAEKGEPFLERARKLQDLEGHMYVLDLNHDDLERMQKAAELTEALGRLWEAQAWCRAALKRDPRSSWARGSINRLAARLTSDTPRVLAEEDPARHIDLSAWPLPNRAVSTAPPSRDTASSERNCGISFEDSAPAAGIRFDYFNGGNPRTETMRMYEFGGGGVAILDFDEDGWPDVYLTQGCAWPPVPGQSRHIDRLFRNMGAGEFRDVTAGSLLGDERFSQGAAIGDFDNDGFADLFVANIGANRLYHNQGDGTFAEITNGPWVDHEDWNTSCLIADLNGDSWPDIYSVTYLTGEDVFTRTCRTEAKHEAPGTCPPRVFEAAPDRVYMNLADGRFADVSESAGVLVPDGKGLGIIAADFDASGMLNLFIANDKVPNFYFVNETAPRGGPLRFAERAAVLGVAYDADGAAKAGMGIAAGDADGDGLLDLVVTNYFHEGNTLYRQQPGHYFVDETRRAGLREPSLAMLGFGTQFLDADLDGLPDLVVANGHTDNYSVSGQPYRMRPQLFRNVGVGRFEELSPGSLGAYFEGAYLGRGAARLDWNRDGREDFLVSHLDAPVALLTNWSASTGHYLAVRLHGVTSDRDAIGTTVRVTAGGKTWARQLVAGDGYMASNQRQLIFGLGTSDRVDEVTVHWLSGKKQSFRELPVDREVIVIEGMPPRLP